MSSEIQISSFSFTAINNAVDIFSDLPPRDKIGMAKTYQSAFGGPPWYERFVCGKCGNFLKEPFCTSCLLAAPGEAYPSGWLINKYFTEMLSAFTPGMLAIARQPDQVIGFTTGGFISLDKLVAEKYSSQEPDRILNSITEYFSITPEVSVFYDNETCIRPDLQEKGLGSELSQIRIDRTVSLGAVAICGRTINRPWLKVKKRQLLTLGFSFAVLVPAGDLFQVDGNPRYFYLAQKEY